MTTPTSAYDQLIGELKEISLLGSTASVLGWDEQTYMPAGGGAQRADQLSLLARLCHERMTSPRFSDLLSKAEEDSAADATAPDQTAASDITVNLRETRRSFSRQSRLPSALVEELAHAGSMAQQAWMQARETDCFADFQPWLEKIIALKRREADHVGSASGDPYDALLDEYEPGMTAAELRRVFDELRGPLVEIVSAVAESGRKAPSTILHRRYPAQAQTALAWQAAQAVGFDFAKGRLDTSTHPFCSMIGPGDTRMTTRYDEHNIGDAFFSVLHETGHGLYDQGLLAEHYGTPCGEYVSLGIHESQSRLWENLVGRGAPFWQWMLPHFRTQFPEQLSDVSDADWMFAINNIEPSLIRTESDEVTYNLHIILRFELEQALLSGELPAADLPGAWSDAMTRMLGVQSNSDADGCLQDIHWSGGAIGYFPTYTLGNLIAAQLYEAALRDLPGLESGFASGDFTPLLGWLRKNVHQHGQRYTSAELVRRSTGADLTAEPLLRRLRAKAEHYYLK